MKTLRGLTAGPCLPFLRNEGCSALPPLMIQAGTVGAAFAALGFVRTGRVHRGRGDFEERRSRSSLRSGEMPLDPERGATHVKALKKLRSAAQVWLKGNSSAYFGERDRSFR